MIPVERELAHDCLDTVGNVLAEQGESNPMSVGEFDTESVLNFGRDSTLRWSCREGDYILWLRMSGGILKVGKPNVIDFWQLGDGDWATITNRIADLPVWFSLHPTEVHGQAARLMMKRLEENEALPDDPHDSPNLWRVLAGDRIAWITDKNIAEIISFEENALVIGSSETNPDPLRFAHVDDTAPDFQRTAISNHNAIEIVEELGMPRTIGIPPWTIGW